MQWTINVVNMKKQLITIINQNSKDIGELKGRLTTVYIDNKRITEVESLIKQTSKKLDTLEKTLKQILTNLNKPTIKPQVKTKQCSNCKKEKPLTSFYKSSKTKDKLQSWCKQCTLEASRKSKSKPIYKTCTKCGLNKSLDNFAKHKAGKYGRRSICNRCQSKYMKEYYKRKKTTPGAHIRISDGRFPLKPSPPKDRRSL